MMKLDLWPIIDAERSAFLDTLKKKGMYEFVQEDTDLLREKQDMFSVRFKGVKILYYYQDGVVFATPWQRIIVYSSKVDPPIVLRNLLGILKLKYFKDEDAHGGGLFWGMTDYGSSEFAYCYINPDYKDGYWDNHTLEVKPIKL